MESEQYPEHMRVTKFVRLPGWWAEDFEVPERFPVLLPASATYLEQRLQDGDPDARCCFQTTWVAAVMGRWITEIWYRGIM